MKYILDKLGSCPHDFQNIGTKVTFFKNGLQNPLSNNTYTFFPHRWHYIYVFDPVVGSASVCGSALCNSVPTVD